jgi:hypothetical protein
VGSGCGLALGDGVGDGEGDAVGAARAGAAGLAVPAGGGARSDATVRAEVIGPKPPPARAEPPCGAEAEAPDAACSPGSFGLGEALDTRMMCGRATVAVGVRCCARRA